MKLRHISVKGEKAMKLAASDFDGTLFKEGTISSEDALAISRWRSAGHKFGVITGRDYGMLLPQLEHFCVESDFAVCNNGAIIFNKNGQARYQAKIDKMTMLKLARHACIKESLHVAFSQEDKTCVYRFRKGSWIFREAAQWHFPLQIIEEKDIENLQTVQQIALGFSSNEAAGQCAKHLNALFGDKIQAYQNRGSVDITPQFISKSQGIKKLLEVMEWDIEQLYVIGDERNDLPMIKEYDGFAIDSAREEIRLAAQRAFLTVGSMLKEFI